MRVKCRPRVDNESLYADVGEAVGDRDTIVTACLASGSFVGRSARAAVMADVRRCLQYVLHRGDALMCCGMLL